MFELHDVVCVMSALFVCVCVYIVRVCMCALCVYVCMRASVCFLSVLVQVPQHSVQLFVFTCSLAACCLCTLYFYTSVAVISVCCVSVGGGE